MRILLSAKEAMKNIIQKWNSISLIKRIICGLILGLVLGLVVPQAAPVSMLGDLFVGALKAVAPILVFFLIFQKQVYSGMANGAVKG